MRLNRIEELAVLHWRAANRGNRVWAWEALADNYHNIRLLAIHEDNMAAEALAETLYKLARERGYMAREQAKGDA